MSTSTPQNNPPALRFDRRTHPRLPLMRPARVVRENAPAGLTFARTADLSVGGALIEIAAPRSFNAGESVRVAVLSDTVVIDPRSMVDAEIVRVEHAGPGRQRIAVRFARQQSLPAAA